MGCDEKSDLARFTKNIIASRVTSANESNRAIHYATFCIYCISLPVDETRSAKQETWRERNRVGRVSRMDGEKHRKNEIMQARQMEKALWFYEVSLTCNNKITSFYNAAQSRSCEDATGFSGLIPSVGLCVRFLILAPAVQFMLNVKKSNVDPRGNVLCPAHLSWLCMLSNRSSPRWIEYPMELS